MNQFTEEIQKFRKKVRPDRNSENQDKHLNDEFVTSTNQQIDKMAQNYLYNKLNQNETANESEMGDTTEMKRLKNLNLSSS